MSAMGSVFPSTLSAALVLLCALLIALQVRRPAAPPRTGPATTGSVFRRAAVIVVIGLWALLMPNLGFFVSSLAAFVLITALATFERPRASTVAVYAVTGIVIVGAFHLVMDRALGLRLPEGWFF
jgi:putative tricarboxylic transport membrane protein